MTGTDPLRAAPSCHYCNEPSYRGTVHPCCEYWSTRAPGLPCPACAASKAAARQRRRYR